MRACADLLFSALRLMGTLSGEAIHLFSFLPPSHLGSTLKEKNLLLLEQILFCKSRPYFGKTWSSK